MRSFEGTTEPIVRVVTFDIVQKDKIVSDLEDRIEKIQDELDYFNQTTNFTL